MKNAVQSITSFAPLSSAMRTLAVAVVAATVVLAATDTQAAAPGAQGKAGSPEIAKWSGYWTWDSMNRRWIWTWVWTSPGTGWNIG